MSYEEIDKSSYGTDVFTNGSEGRYAKPNHVSETVVKTGEKKKKAPKIDPPPPEYETIDHPQENGQTDEVPKPKKKSRKVQENGDETSQVVPPADGETVVKPKKTRAPKAESNIENVDPIPSIEEPVKKRKTKAPKPPPTEEDYQMIDSTVNDLEPTAEQTPKVRKPKKHKTPKPTTDTLDDTQINNNNDAYSINTGIYL